MHTAIYPEQDRIPAEFLNAAYTLDWADEAGTLSDSPNLKPFVEKIYARPTAAMTIVEGFVSLRK